MKTTDLLAKGEGCEGLPKTFLIYACRKTLGEAFTPFTRLPLAPAQGVKIKDFAQ